MTRQNDQKGPIDTESIENLLARLTPAPQDELAATISTTLENISVQTVSKQQRQPYRSPTPLYRPFIAGMLGLVVGATAMFLLMTLTQFPPRPVKTEIREIVREVVVEVPVSVAHDSQPDLLKKERIVGDPLTSETAIFTETPSGDSTGLLPMIFGLKNVTSRPPVSFGSFDLDKIIDEAAIRQNSLAVAHPRYTLRESVPVLPHAEYREMIRQVLGTL